MCVGVGVGVSVCVFRTKAIPYRLSHMDIDDM